MFAELFYGSVSTIITKDLVVWILPKEHFETWTPENFSTITLVISKYFNGNSDNFHSLNFSPVFLQQEGKYMNNW